MKRAKHNDRIRTAAKLRARKARENLSEGYVRGLLTRGSACLKPKDLPQSLVEAQRALVLLKRALRECSKDGQISPGTLALGDRIVAMNRASKERT
jgi:hypothetical protein